MRAGLILEDHRDTADRVERLLVRAFPSLQVTRAETLAEAREALQMHPDIALIDLELPDGSGLDLVRLLVEKVPTCLSVIMTLYGDDQHLFPALREGAKGYLLKSDTDEAVMQNLGGIANGEPPLSASVARRILDHFTVPPTDDPKLSPRERETLILVAKGFRVTEVARQMGVATSTAQSFVKSIYQKLAISSRAEAALEAARRGLIGSGV